MKNREIELSLELGLKVKERLTVAEYLEEIGLNIDEKDEVDVCSALGGNPYDILFITTDIAVDYIEFDRLYSDLTIEPSISTHGRYRVKKYGDVTLAIANELGSHIIYVHRKFVKLEI